ncbi:D-2-hydroxyacid dehydrogenase [Bythopirellula polymerisocia]|uniref:Glycerate dehydrogenase n=1 Tax=Bythopirellula polymerisocia TaxID=2528003 RepID=A0A5C6C9L9_9BACT|nr:D-2-hydroxyacid dehydrogenase [Bythopirellula polymerisocia]TWU20076.1 Glycerate dehydrogenase [Bythopirellula polymerisocia]
MRIVLCYPVELRHLEQIQAAWPGAEIVDAGQERIASELANADIYCGHAKVPVPWDEVVAKGKLQWIQSSAAGMDHCLTPAVVQSEILVTSASGVLAKQVADHTMALLAGMLRDLPTYFRAKDKREFIRRPTRDLHGTTIGIVGMGGNGRVLARVLKPFETTILATDWFPEKKPVEIDELLPADALDDLLPRVDVLILAAPLNDYTRGMIDERRLRLLKKDAVLVNMARGPLVVEEDLVKVMKEGHLWGAGLDVTAEEPLPAESPLWEVPNLILTPHVGGQRASRIDDMTRLFLENSQRFQAGKPLINKVDKILGFPEAGAILFQS